MTDPEKHDCAVAFCVDRTFYPFSLFMIWQISQLNPHRQFDFVIASQDDLVVPDWAKPLGILLHRPGAVPEYARHARLKSTASNLFRLMLARELGDRYRRIIYMDSDIHVAGGDLGRLMEIDLGPHPIGAVLDYIHFIRADSHAEQYRVSGLPALPYLNSGFQVIDTKAHLQQEVERGAFDMCKTYTKRFAGDQAILNLALRGNFAQLAVLELAA